jgi:biopolymer transport protein ExbB
MIETFSSLTGLQAYSGDATMAGGISKALISTQMGLLVAIPGVMVGRLLDRREDVLRDELLQTSEMIERTNQARLEALR